MRKRASVVAVLLATSFLGSLLALVLLGRNPLVGPSPSGARTGPLRQEIEGSPLIVPSPDSSSAIQDTPEPDADVVPATSVPDAQTGYRGGPPEPAAGEEAVEPAPPPAPEPPAGEEISVSKTAANGAGPVEGFRDEGDDAAKKTGGRPGSKSSPKGPQDEPASDGGGTGPGKGSKGEKDKGPGNGGKQPPGQPEGGPPGHGESPGEAKGKP